MTMKPVELLLVRGHTNVNDELFILWYWSWPIRGTSTESYLGTEKTRRDVSG